MVMNRTEGMEVWMVEVEQVARIHDNGRLCDTDESLESSRRQKRNDV